MGLKSINSMLGKEAKSIIMNEEMYYRLCFELNEYNIGEYFKPATLLNLPISIANVENIIIGYKPE